MSEKRTVVISPVEWADLLAEAFERGKWAAYSAERDGFDGSEVPNPYADGSLKGTSRAAIARIEALAEDWDAPLGDYQWFAAEIRAALRGDA